MFPYILRADEIPSALYYIYFAVNAPPNNGRRNTPMPTSENNTTPIDTTATAAMTYLIIFFISYNIKVFLMIFSGRVISHTSHNPLVLV